MTKKAETSLTRFVDNSNSGICNDNCISLSLGGSLRTFLDEIKV